jgi:rhamnosyltransferase
MTSVSIVVRALNEAEHLPALFTGLLRQTVRPTEVVLVDSGSTDESVAIAEAHGARIVRIRPEDFSFGSALNAGCEAAKGDIIAFASAHVYPLDSHWLENLIAPFVDPDVALVYGRQTGDHRSNFSEIQLMRRWFPDESDPDQDSPFCNNANCAVRASVWDELPYDEQLTGLEDVDWANRALARGHRLAYRADAVIAHVHSESFTGIRNRYRREAIAHKQIFNDQRMGALEALGLFVASTGRDYLSAIAQHRLRHNVGAIPMFRAGQFLGTWEGMRQQGEVSLSLKRRFYYPNAFGPRSGRRR